MALLQNTETGSNLFWQIENNGSWHWEISDQMGNYYLQLSGPTETESHWWKNLQPGETFTTVPVAIGSVIGGFDEAMGELTKYRRVIRRNASVKEALWVSRGFVVVIALVATGFALFPSDTIFNIVKFAWGGFGAAFGPVVIMSLYSKRTTWISALAGMVAGTVVMLVWYFLGLNRYMYEILPGFIVNFVVIFVVNLFVKQEDEDILKSFDDVKAYKAVEETAEKAEEKAEA